MNLYCQPKQRWVKECVFALEGVVGCVDRWCSSKPRNLGPRQAHGLLAKDTASSSGILYDILTYTDFIMCCLNSCIRFRRSTTVQPLSA